MGALLNKVMSDMIREFKLGHENNVEIIKEMDSGLSGAEVYLVELKDSSNYKGKYYLKLDGQKNSSKNLNEIKFSRIAKILESSFIDGIHVTLMQIAGNSSISYKPLSEIDSPSLREDAIHNVLPVFLQEALGCVNLNVQKSTLSKISQRMLGGKLNKDREIVKFLNMIVDNNYDFSGIKSFYYENEDFPSAFSYVTMSKNENEICVHDIPCLNHGDFHDNNLLYSSQDNDYALIDLELYNEKGFVFYDTAYMEINLLLRNMKAQELHKWNNVVKNLAQSNWAELDCLDKQVLKAITDEEEKWIETQTTSNCNYKDELIEARHVARIIAGLNFAGKRNVEWDVFQKAYIYACFNLKELFKKSNFFDWREGQYRWPAVLGSRYNEDSSKECRRFIDSIDSFNPIRKFVMILGDEFDNNTQKLEGLERIAWTGIVNFSSKDELEKWWRSKRLVNVITLTGNMMLLDANNLWLVYINGVTYEPDSIIDNFVDWRNRTRRFLGGISDRIQEEIAPDDIEFVLYLDSFSSDAKRRLEKLFEILDTIDNAAIHISILSHNSMAADGFKEICNNIKFDAYDTSIDTLAAYCCEYVQGRDVGLRTIPGKNNRRVVLSDELLSNAPPRTEVLHSKIIYEEKYISEKDMYGFFYGEKIFWQAVRDNKWIGLDAYNSIESKILSSVESGTSNNMIIDVPYTPGAGASVACRVLAWKMHNDYPAVIMNTNHRMIVPFVQKLYSLSGKGIILFLDGDFSYSEVRNIERQMYEAVTRVCIVYFYRDYSKQYESIAENGISRLDGNTALNFAMVYADKMNLIMSYNEDIINQRKEHMSELATRLELMPYRLPFFFGLSAFETDFKGIDSYIQQVLDGLHEDEGKNRIITYIALVTYYTSVEGLKLSYAKKLIKKYLNKDEVPNNTVIDLLNDSKHRFVFYAQGALRICHPVIAERIIKGQYNVSSTLFVNFINEFINDVYDCEAGVSKSNVQKELFGNLFLSRNIEGVTEENSNEWKKQRFSQLILDVGNKNQQEQIFKYLTSKFPDNPHFWHHYGRLVIENHPNSIEKAKRLFDKALELEPENPIHFHARGEMYKKHIKFLCAHNRKSGVVETYNLLAVMTENAINDFQASIHFIQKNRTGELSLVYPFSSIISTTTYVVNVLYRKNNINAKNAKVFLLADNMISNWCKNILQIAKQVRLQTVIRYDALNRDDFFKQVCTYLVHYDYTPEEIEEQIKNKFNDRYLLHSYMYATVCKMNEWPDKSSAQLKRIREIASRLILSSKENNEGVMWQWFNASLYDDDADLSEMVGFLETLHDCNNNMSAQFMLYVIKLGEFLNTGNAVLVDEVLDHMKKCRELSDNSQRKSIRYYYCGNKTKVGFSAKLEQAIEVEGTVSKWIGGQNGRIALDKDSHLKVFFVPSAIGMNVDGAVGTKVKFFLGVSFDGLRSHSVSRVFD